MSLVLNQLKNTIKTYRMLLDKESGTPIKGANYILVDHTMPRRIRVVNGSFINAPTKVEYATRYSKTEAKEFAEFFGHNYVHVKDYIEGQIRNLENIVAELSE